MGTVDTAAPSEEALRTFAGLATNYDQFTACDNYARLGAILHELIQAARPPGRRLLDVGCGTGKSSIALAAHGYQVTGCDISTPMLELARSKHGARGIDFRRADMRSLDSIQGTFDVVSCIDDVVNFLLVDDDLRAAFHAAARVLAPQGVYIFDSNTLRTYRTWYSSDEIRENGDLFFAWRGHCDPAHQPGQRAEADLYTYRRHPTGDHWSRNHVSHVQRHHTLARVEELLRAAGLEPLAAYGLHTTGTVRAHVDETLDGKTIHVARKPGLPRRLCHAPGQKS